MVNKVVSLSPRLQFLKTGERTLKAPDGKAFHFKLNTDQIARMRYITVIYGQKDVGHFDFSMHKNWMHVLYSAFATSSDSYSEWAYGCLKDPAIEVYEPWRNIYRGIGKSMVSLVLQWGRNRKLNGMRIIDPQTPELWEKLHFVWKGEDQIFEFGRMRIPLTGIYTRETTNEKL